MNILYPGCVIPTSVLRSVHKIAKSHYQPRYALPSVCSHGTSRHPLDEYWWNLILRIFRKYVYKIQVSLKSGKHNGCFTRRHVHIYIYAHIYIYITEFFLEWEMFRQKKKIVPFMRRCGKAEDGQTGHRWQWYGAGSSCRISKARLQTYAVGSKRFRPDIQKPRQMENAARDI
jgi:hypothetical protein